MEKYKFRLYNKNFPLLYKREKSKLKKILPKSAHIEHIGSSSVNGLRGKGLIDIVIGTSKKDLLKIKKILEKEEYEFRPLAGDKNRLFFKRDYIVKGKTRRVHIHLTIYMGKDWLKMIAVRDCLRNNKDEIRKYEKIKKKAVKLAKGDGKIYRRLKKKYLESLTPKALKFNKTKNRNV